MLQLIVNITVNIINKEYRKQNNCLKYACNLYKPFKLKETDPSKTIK